MPATKKTKKNRENMASVKNGGVTSSQNLFLEKPDVSARHGRIKPRIKITDRLGY